MGSKNLLVAIMASCLIWASPSFAATSQAEPQFEPFRIAGDLYYVGGTHGSYLIATPDGLILINSNYPDSPPLIRQSIEKLGFRWMDLKILLISHAHVDHAGGSAQIIRETGARYMVMAGDADVVESGGRTDFYYGSSPAEYYPPAHVDRVLHDGDNVALGGKVLTAHLTPGHTKGTTTWSFSELLDGKLRSVAVIGGSALNRDVNLIDNPRYSGISDDYRKGFAAVRTLPCDIPLGAHDRYFNLQTKLARLNAGDKAAFVDPQGCNAWIDRSEKAFNDLLEHERQLVAEGKPAGR